MQYYPNGAVQQFVYGNGIVHQMQQNARQLPARSTDTGTLGGTRNLRGADASGRYGLDHDAWAASAGWFLSGASPSYSAKAGTWGKVKVADPVTSGGRGAWELRGRYEDVDYAELPTGGTGHAWTVGANWFLNDYSRVMFDVTRWETDNRSGAVQGKDEGTTFNTRLQVTF